MRIEFGKTRVAIVCGGRRYGETMLNKHEPNPFAMRERARLFAVLDASLDRLGIQAIVHGSCPTGADYWADQWAMRRKVPCKAFPAYWHDLGRAAGPERNGRMLKEALPFCVIAFPGGAGTADMMRQATGAGVKVHEIK